MPTTEKSGVRPSLRNLLSDGPVMVGSCHDGISAAVFEEAGFPVIAVGGATVSASLLGVPDLGLLTLSEISGVAQRIISRAGVPVIVDIDTGFGGALNVVRTIDEMLRIGASAVHLEDQVLPKKCGHAAGKGLVSTDEYVTKVRAAVSTRGEADMMIIARTDAITVTGVDDAIDRALRALDVGADAAMIESPRSMAEIDLIAEKVPGHKLYSVMTGGLSPRLSVAELNERGFDIVMFPTMAVYPMIDSLRKVAAEILRAGDDTVLRPFEMVPEDLFTLFDIDAWRAAEATFSTTPTSTP